MKVLMLLWSMLSLTSPVMARQVVDHVVAIVNNDVITQREVDNLFATMGSALRSSQATAGGLRSRAIERLIDERLLQQAMAKERVELSAEELDAAFQQFLAANHLTRAQFQGALAQRGMRVETFREQMAGQLRQMKFLQSTLGNDIQLDDHELRNFYHRQVNPTVGTTYHISEIVLAPPASRTRDHRAVIKKAARLAQNARTGEFAKVAKAHSTSTTAATGGERGAVQLADLRPELASAVQRLRVGQVSEPIVTPDGVFIIKLNAARSSADDDFAHRKSQIQQALFHDKMSEALEQYLGRLRAKAYIEIRD